MLSLKITSIYNSQQCPTTYVLYSKQHCFIPNLNIECELLLNSP